MLGMEFLGKATQQTPVENIPGQTHARTAHLAQRGLHTLGRNIGTPQFSTNAIIVYGAARG